MAVVTVTIPSGSSGTVDFTDPSITGTFKSALFLYALGDGTTTPDSKDNAHGVIGMGGCSTEGTADAGRNFSYCTQGNNAALAQPDYNTSRFNSRGVHLVSGTNVNSTVVNLKYNSAISGGVRMDIVTSTATVKVTAILFAIAHAGIARPSLSGVTTGNEDVGDTPFFTPQALISFGGGGALGTDTPDAEVSLGFGANNVGLSQVAAFISLDDGTEGTDGDGEIASAKFMMQMPGGASARTATRGNVTSYDAQGYNWASDGTVAAMVMALRFSGDVRVACANMAVSASTGLQAFNAFGFTPDLVIGMSTLMAAVDTPTDGTTAASAGLFVTGRYGSRAITMHGEEGLTNGAAASFNTHNRSEDVALLTYNHTGGIAQRATWAGASGSGGFLFDFSVATAGFITAIGIQLVPNPPLPLRRIRRIRRPRVRRRRRLATILGRVVGQPPLLRGFWKAISRIRRATLMRLRRPAVIPLGIRPVGASTDEPSKGRIFTPGVTRGRLSGPGVAADDIE